MICGECKLAQFNSMPNIDLLGLGAFKCPITSERHYYSDLCNCEVDRISQETEQDKFYEMIRKPLWATGPYCHSELNTNLPDDIGAVKVTAYEYPFKIDQIDVEKLSEFDKKPPLAAVIDTIVNATKCLVCGEAVMIAAGERSGPRICNKCKKAILYIRDKFEKELENYEV